MKPRYLFFALASLLAVAPTFAQPGIEIPAVEVVVETEPPAPAEPALVEPSPPTPVVAEPAAVEAPVIMAPVAIGVPVAVEAPVAVEVPAAVEAPVAMERPVVVEAPVAVEVAPPAKIVPPATSLRESESPVANAPMPAVVAPEGSAPVVNTAPEIAAPVEPQRPVQAAPSAETAQVLAEPEKRDRGADQQAARTIKDDKDASRLIYTILGGAAAGAIAAKVVTSGGRNDAGYGTRGVPGHDYPTPQRPSEAETGRSRRDREASVGYMSQQFSGQGGQGAPGAHGQGAPGAYGQGGYGQAPGYGGRPGQGYPDQPAQYREAPPRSAPTYYEGNRRIVHYSSQSEIPPILMANSYLDRVEVAPSYEADYRQISEAPRWANTADRPAEYYQSQSAYSVSYQVDPNSAVSRDDILFGQGSTAFADAYSYDVVIDMAEAMNQPNLRNEAFIIEGHASAEGSYGSNLSLSQLRAERIAQELVRYGVSPERLLPVGYGESEASYPADAPDQYRRLDRRVMIFRMEE